MSTTTCKKSSVPRSVDLSSASFTQRATKPLASVPESPLEEASALASARAAATNDALRERIATCSSERNAENTTASPSTSPTSTSSESCLSEAASINSAATWNVIETDKSLPIAVRAAPVVPPAPVSSEVASDIQSKANLVAVGSATSADARAANSEREVLFRPFLESQFETKAPSLQLRRLLLRTPGVRRGRHDTGVQISSSVFGCVLGNLIGHCLLPKAKRCNLIVVIRERLLRMVRLLSLSSGEDVQFLARGLASAPIVRSQRRNLAELRIEADVHKNSRHGNIAAAIGATAAIITCIAILTSKKTALWIHGRAVLLSAFVRAESMLTDWMQMSAWDPEARGSLEAERRAICRACKAVQVAILMSTEQNLDPFSSIRLQLAAAERAAFPPAWVGSTTHESLLEKIEQRELLGPDLAQTEALPPSTWSTRPVQDNLKIVPLAALLSNKSDTDDTESSSSSSVSGGTHMQSDAVSEVSAFEELEVGSVSES